MFNNIPTKRECDVIVENSEAFFRNETIVEGCEVRMYNYRLASLSDFKDNNAFELRGITFVKTNNGWERNILLHKFFNVNQTEDYMLEDVKDKKIISVQDKADGSLISFVRFSNGKVRAKSKMSFISMQAEMAQEVYDNNEDLRNFVAEQLDKGYAPIFEIVSPSNQIVVQYEETKLVLLQVRDKNGAYIDNLKVYTFGHDIDIVESMPLSYYNIDDLMARKEIDDSNIEGWVVTFEDGQIAKIKTNHYLQLHGLIGPDAFRENLLIETILDGNIDDVVSSLVEGYKKTNILDIEQLVTDKFNHLVQEFVDLYSKYDGNRKEFALEYRSMSMFGYVMKSISVEFNSDNTLEKFAEESVKNYILNKTKSLEKAKEWLKTLEK